MDFLLGHKCYHTTDHPQYGLRRQLVGHCDPSIIIQDTINGHLGLRRMVRYKVQGLE
jgi:hypothetical protein